MSTPSQQIHLVVLIHGMWGNPGHLAEAARIFDETRVQLAQKDADGVQLRVLLAETNSEESTYDGIDWGGERVAQEVFDEMDKVAQEGGKVTRFSTMGYSLGGLVARYVIGIMHQKGIFDSVTPVNFNTIATPHIGLLKYPTWFSKLAHTMGPRLLSRTGEQFFAVDKWSKRGRPLVEVMADPERIFYQALALFPHVRIYANALNDMTVPYCTAAIEREDIFVNYRETGLSVEYQEGYKPIVKSWTIPDEPPAPIAAPTPFSIAWFKTFKDIPLPPRLQKSFPANIAIILLLPVLIPSFVGFAMVRLSLSSRSSRARVKLLEKGDSPRLLSLVAELEREIEDFVIDAAEAGNNPRALSSKLSSSVRADAVSRVTKKAKAKDIPTFSAPQERAIAHLNALPQLKKEHVWIPDVRNSHATIIARDVANFPFHKVGQGVLRHWADHFLL